MNVQPDLYVSQTGKTSVVNILPADNVKDAMRYADSSRPDALTQSVHSGSSWDVVARPRTGPPTNFGHDMHNSHVLTSNVVREIRPDVTM